MEMRKDQTYDAMSVLMEYIEPILKNATSKRRETSMSTGKDEETFLDHMVKSTDGGLPLEYAHSLSPHLTGGWLRYQGAQGRMSQLDGGRKGYGALSAHFHLTRLEIKLYISQTASLLSFGMYMLAEHPTVFQRLRAEVLETVGSTRAPTYDDIRSMKYMRAFLNGMFLLGVCEER